MQESDMMLGFWYIKTHVEQSLDLTCPWEEVEGIGFLVIISCP